MATADSAKQTLVDYLQRARDAMLWKLDGLDEYDVRRPLTPTGTNLLGLVKHLAGVELGYFGDTFGRPSPVPLPWQADEGDINADMWARPDETRESVIDLYRTAWQHAAQTFRVTELDDHGSVPWWPAERADVTLHQVLVHVATETHRHAGHADVVREIIDGQVGRMPMDANIVGGYDWGAHVARVEAGAVAARTMSGDR